MNESATTETASLEDHPPREQLGIEDHSVTNPVEDETQYPSGRPVLFVLLAGALALFLVGLDGQILATAIPAITAEFRTILDIGWYNASLRLTLCSLLFFYGKLYTILSSKKILLVSVFIFEVGSLLCGLSPTSLSLILGRAVQGIGSGGIVMGSYAIVNATIPKRKRPFVLGCLGAVEVFSQAIAPLIGGVLVTRVSWRWCFYINLPIGALSMAVIAKFYHDHKLPPHHNLSLFGKFKLLDPVGTLLLLPGLLSLLLALQYGGTVYSWSDPRVLVCFIVFGLLTAVFVWWQFRQQDAAMLPPRILGQRVVLAGMLFLVSTNGTISIIQYYIPSYFQTVQQASAQTSGYLVLPFLVPFILSVALSGTLVSATGYYFPFMLFTALVTPVAAGLLLTLTVDSSLVRISAYLALLGLGSGVGFHGPQYAVQALLAQSDLQYGIACLQFGQKFGPAIVIPAAQAIFLNSLIATLRDREPGVSASVIQNLSLSDLKSVVKADQFQETLLSFDTAFAQTFYLPTALASTIILGVLATKSKSLKKP